MYRHILALLFISNASAADPAAVFDERILPIFKSPKPGSCVKCHLAGVDLKDYILPDAESTFRSLRDQGLIDLAAPEKSKIVALIGMGSKGAIPDVVQKAEREAFLAWITACAADDKLKAMPKLDGQAAGPATKNEVIRHARKDRVLESFENDVWAWRFRCMNCHTEGTPQNDKNRKTYGDRVAWVKKDGAAATMDYLIASKLIDLKQPEKSLLLTKPRGVDHEGGKKFAPGDDADKGFRAWIDDVAKMKAGSYKTPAELPVNGKESRFGTDIWFKITDGPPAWGDKLLRVRIHAWDAKAKAWEKEPLAVSDRIVAPAGKLWQHSMTLLAAKDSDRAKAWKTKPVLPPGKYLAKIEVDRGNRLAKDATATFAKGDFAGEVEFTAAWKPGYSTMTTVKADKLK